MTAMATRPGSGAAAGAPDGCLAWEVELDRLELDILRVERLIRAIEPLEDVDWSEPDLPTPLPLQLLPRAMEIHERQAKVLHEVVRALQRTGRQRSFASHVAHATAETPGPAYVDLRG